MPEHMGPALIDPQGGRHELTRRQYELIVSMTASLGLDIARAADATTDAIVSTGQAAEILGVSRRTVTRMLDRGELPGIRLGPNHHRSVRLVDVLAFRDRGGMKVSGQTA